MVFVIVISFVCHDLPGNFCLSWPSSIFESVLIVLLIQIFCPRGGGIVHCQEVYDKSKYCFEHVTRLHECFPVSCELGNYCSSVIGNKELISMSNVACCCSSVRAIDFVAFKSFTATAIDGVGVIVYPC